MGLEEATDAPVVIGGVTFQRLTNRNLGVIAAKYKAATMATVNSAVAEDKGSDEAKLRFKLTNATACYGLEDVWVWSQSFDGATAMAIESLVQGGQKREEAATTVAALSAAMVRDAAMEASDHPGAPSKKKVEGKKNADPPDAP